MSQLRTQKTMTIDGRIFASEREMSILGAAERLGISIPRLCAHPDLIPSGRCGICLVEVEGRHGLVRACAEAMKPGMRVLTGTEAARRARAERIGELLRDHPVACPSCDAAGECELQTLACAAGSRPPAISRSVVQTSAPRRLTPNVVVFADRCVRCGRCQDFCEQVLGCESEQGDAAAHAGEVPWRLLERGIARAYALCAVDLCPAGALVAAPSRFQRKRSWMLTSAQTVCVECARGCRALLDHHAGKVSRLRSLQPGNAQRPWLCDEGRKGIDQIDADDRVLQPMILEAGAYRKASFSEAYARWRDLLQGFDAARVIGVFSARASLEENLALERCVHELCCAAGFCFSGNQEDEGFGDDLLRLPERGGNLKGVRLISNQECGAMEAGMGMIVLEGLSRDHLLSVVASRPAWIILLASHYGARERWADVVLPKAMHVEQEGTFLNADGTAQRAHAAVPPPAAARPAWSIASGFVKSLGEPWELIDADACRAYGRKSIPAIPWGDEA